MSKPKRRIRFRPSDYAVPVWLCRGAGEYDWCLQAWRGSRKRIRLQGGEWVADDGAHKEGGRWHEMLHNEDYVDIGIAQAMFNLPDRDIPSPGTAVFVWLDCMPWEGGMEIGKEGDNQC